MNEKEFFITVRADEYADLLKAETELDCLIGTLLNTAELNYRHDALSFSDSTLCAILKTVAPYQYEQKVNELQAKELDSTTIKV